MRRAPRRAPSFAGGCTRPSESVRRRILQPYTGTPKGHPVDRRVYPPRLNECPRQARRPQPRPCDVKAEPTAWSLNSGALASLYPRIFSAESWWSLQQSASDSRRRSRWSRATLIPHETSRTLSRTHQCNQRPTTGPWFERWAPRGPVFERCGGPGLDPHGSNFATFRIQKGSHAVGLVRRVLVR
jgi:hypothetical protein